MAIPTVLNNLLDYADFNRRTKEEGAVPTYIWVKKGKKEEAWAVCSLLGMIVDGDFEVGGHPIANTYIFAKQSDAPLPGGHFAIGVEGRFHLRDLQFYFYKHEADNADN